MITLTDYKSTAIPARTTQPIIGTYYRYYFAGHEAQFRVYAVFTLADTPTGRVIKVPLDFAESKQAIWEPLRHIADVETPEELDVLADERAREVMRFKHDMPNLIQGVLGKDAAFVRALGDLKILQTPIPVTDDTQPAAYHLPIFFIQDYVITLDDYLQRFRLATNNYTRILDEHSIQLTTRNHKKSVGYWVARHNLTSSLYHGFAERNIDDLDIPSPDLQLLIADKNQRDVT